MRPVDFHNVLNGQVDGNQLLVLEETAKRFPYFSAAQVLLAKEYWQQDHLDKQFQLEKASLRMADRTYLYNFLHNQIEELAVEPVEVSKEIEESQVEKDVVAKEEKVQQGLPDELIPDLHVYDISMAPNLVTDVESEVEEDIELDFVGWLNSMGKDDSVEEIPIKETDPSVDLIGQFIENDPKISKREDVKFYSPQEMGRKSVEDDFGFVSETLAQIYEDQGDLEKAIKAYRSLQLRYPEKSSYFAARLKKLEKQ